jgi:sialic acid synthase SpsE
MIAQLREVEVALGSADKEPTAAELPVRALVRRSVTLARSMAAGQVLTRADVVLLRPGNGIEPKALELVIGRALRHDLPAGQTLTWDDFLE